MVLRGRPAVVIAGLAAGGLLATVPPMRRSPTVSMSCVAATPTQPGTSCLTWTLHWSTTGHPARTQLAHPAQTTRAPSPETFSAANKMRRTVLPSRPDGPYTISLARAFTSPTAATPGDDQSPRSRRDGLRSLGDARCDTTRQTTTRRRGRPEPGVNSRRLRRSMRVSPSVVRGTVIRVRRALRLDVRSPSQAAGRCPGWSVTKW
jgi:hypothetical protein